MTELEPRKSFYEDELNMDRVNIAIEYIASNLTLKEALKLIREISYDMVSYWDKENCARIYKDKSYSKLNQEQACRLQRLLSTACDLFGQSVINKREFDEGYLLKWCDGGSLELENNRLKEKVEQLEYEVNYLKNGGLIWIE